MKDFKLGVQSYYYTICVRPKPGAKWVEYYSWRNYSIECFSRWKWYFKYRAALLQIKYPKYVVQEKWGGEAATGLTKQQLESKLKKNAISTSKRMITKISRSIEKYEEEEKKKLLPDWNNPKYLKTKEKLVEYIDKLYMLEKENIISGSDIKITFDSITGNVQSVTGDNPYNIKRIDIDEYKTYYKLKIIPQNIDVLTIGYWYENNKYQPAEKDYRKEISK